MTNRGWYKLTSTEFKVLVTYQLRSLITGALRSYGTVSISADNR